MKSEYDLTQLDSRCLATMLGETLNGVTSV